MIKKLIIFTIILISFPLQSFAQYIPGPNEIPTGEEHYFVQCCFYERDQWFCQSFEFPDKDITIQAYCDLFITNAAKDQYPLAKVFDWALEKQLNYLAGEKKCYVNGQCYMCYLDLETGLETCYLVDEGNWDPNGNEEARNTEEDPDSGAPPQ